MKVFSKQDAPTRCINKGEMKVFSIDVSTREMKVFSTRCINKGEMKVFSNRCINKGDESILNKMYQQG